MALDDDRYRETGEERVPRVGDHFLCHGIVMLRMGGQDSDFRKSKIVVPIKQESER